MAAATKSVMIAGLLTAGLVWGGVGQAQETKTTFFQGPSPCSVVDKIENDKVYLTTPAACTQGGQGMLNVSVSAGLGKVNLYNNGSFWKNHTIMTLDSKMVDGAMKKGEGAEKDLKTKGVSADNNRFSKQAAEAAGKSAETVYSDAFQAKVKAEQERLKVEVFGEQLRGTPVDPQKPVQETPGRKFLAEDERVYLFFSSSMPEATVRTYLAALDNARDPLAIMVMRGFVGGADKIKPTMDYMQRLMAKDPACIPQVQNDKKCESFLAEVQIDPLLFNRYKITKVPAVVFVRGVKNIAGMGQVSEGMDENYQVGSWWALEGDAALDYMLERINKESQSPSLTAFVKAIRKGFY